METDSQSSQQTSTSAPDTFAAIQERDIDLLLLEEFRCHSNFPVWFYGNTHPSKSVKPFRWNKIQCEPKHSIGWSGVGSGETDLWVKLTGVSQSENQHVVLFLIENKISAPFTPNQPERYQQRSELERQAAGADEVRTVLVAPQGYLDTCGTGEFTSKVPYEQIIIFLEESAKKSVSRELQLRLKHRAQILRCAVNGYRRSGGQGIIYSETITTFFEKCYELLNKEFVNRLNAHPNKKRGSGSTSISFRFKGRDRLVQASNDSRNELFIILWLPEGKAAVRFHHWPSYVDVLHEQLESIIPGEFSINIAPSGKTVDLVIDKLPVVNTTLEFEPQVQDFRKCLERVVTLKEWIEGKVSNIEGWLLNHK